MKAIKKIMVAVLLSLSMVVSFMPINVFAADTWDGTADTSWYVGHETDNEYHITTAEQLAGLAQLVNAAPGKTNFSGKNFYLENDLDLSGHEWISIGTGRGGTDSKYGFCGVFDGQSHVISNLYSHESYIEGADESHNLLRNALFGNVYDGEIKNLGVENAEIWIDPLDDSAAGKGILVDWLGKSKITNCWTSGSIYSGTKIEKNIGGIVGVTVQGCTISGCYSTATLTGNFTNSDGYYTDPDDLPIDTIGGIVGARFDGSLTVSDCWFGGKIEVNSIIAAVGGIVGYTDTMRGTATVKNYVVATTDMDVDSDGNTCWVAYALGGSIENCYWPEDKKAYDPSPLEAVAGIAAELQGSAVSDFNSKDVLSSLQNNAGTGIEWVAGINHPTFIKDDRNILADYTKVDEAIANAQKIDANLYSNYSIVEDAINAVDHAKSKYEQTTVDSYADVINKAISELKYKDADYTKVNEAKAKVPSDLSIYTDETVKVLKDALALVEEGKNITEQATVDGYASAINKAIEGLVKKNNDKNETPVKDDNKKNDSTSNNQETVKPTIKEETKTTVKAENKEDVKKVKTGDNENIIGIALLLVGSLVVLTYIRKKKID